jgi:hypothetical protein
VKQAGTPSGAPQAVTHSAAPPAPQRPHPHKTPPVPQRPHPHKSPMLTRPHPHQVPQFTDVVISTAPAVAGYPVTVEGTTHLTDASGKVSFTTPLTSQALTDRASFGPTTLTIDGRQVKVSPIRLYRYPTGAQLALDLSYPVSFRFSNVKDLNGAAIDNVAVRSSTGQVATLPPAQPSWLEGARAVPQDAGLEVRNVEWSVQRVTYGGSNVVNESQQRFTPASQGVVDVALLFYSVRFHVHDALFGTVDARSVDLTFPNGRTQRLPLDSQGSLALPLLPRGDYVLTAIGTGPSVQLPLTISRNQVVNVQFFSWLDVGTVVGAVLVLGALLAFAGRLRRRARFVRRLALRRGLRPVVVVRTPRAVPQPSGVHAALPMPRSSDEQPAALTAGTDHTPR